MPYIKKEKRPRLDILVEEMVELCLQNPDGNLNYVLFKLARYIKPSYNNYKNYIGELNECIAEIRRKILSQYEDEKEQENGTVLQ
jgi:hypothetical protein